MDLEALDAWLKGYKLSMNVAKTQSMTISTNHKQAALDGENEQLNLVIRDKTLEVVQSTKYLGVQIDNPFDWTKHIQETSRNLEIFWYAKIFKRIPSY